MEEVCTHSSGCWLAALQFFLPWHPHSSVPESGISESYQTSPHWLHYLSNLLWGCRLPFLKQKNQISAAFNLQLSRKIHQLCISSVIPFNISKTDGWLILFIKWGRFLITLISYRKMHVYLLLNVPDYVDITTIDHYMEPSQLPNWRFSTGVGKRKLRKSLPK